MVGNIFIPEVRNVHQVFFKAGIECTSCFADVEFGAFSTTNHIVSLAIKTFGNIHGAFRPLDLDRGTDERLRLSWLHGVVPGVWEITFGTRVLR